MLGESGEHDSYSQCGALHKVNTKSTVCGSSTGISLKTKYTQQDHKMLGLIVDAAVTKYHNDNI